MKLLRLPVSAIVLVIVLIFCPISISAQEDIGGDLEIRGIHGYGNTQVILDNTEQKFRYLEIECDWENEHVQNQVYLFEIQEDILDIEITSSCKRFNFSFTEFEQSPISEDVDEMIMEVEIVSSQKNARQFLRLIHEPSQDVFDNVQIMVKFDQEFVIAVNGINFNYVSVNRDNMIDPTFSGSESGVYEFWLSDLNSINQYGFLGILRDLPFVPIADEISSIEMKISIP